MERRALLLPAVAALAFAAFWWSNHHASASAAIPAASWCVGAGPEYTLGRPADALAPETPFRLRVQCSEPRHVYVFSHSDTDGTLLLHPAPELQGGVAQPLAVDAAWLPGRANDKALAWTTRRSSARGLNAAVNRAQPTTTFVVVAAAAKVAELEALLPNLRRWSNSAATDGSMQVVMPPGGETTLVGKPLTLLPDPLLQRAANLSATATLANGPLTPDAMLAGVWTGSWRVKEQVAAPADGR
ncbi:MAG: hypothetical protein FJ301_04130 [Planctomycetes bacterium]|nr:hypothetical protein [Planctomycetota bacterium]